MSRRPSLVRLLSVLAFLAIWGVARTARADPILIGGPWEEFSFTSVGNEARGCFPADPFGIDCIPSSAGNSEFAGAPAWTFTDLDNSTILTLTDAFLRGDAFEIFDNLVSIGTTPLVASVGGCGSNPDNCLADPLVSHAIFILPPGMHSITIVPINVIEPGAAYFEVTEGPAVPEPATWLLILTGLVGVAATKRLTAKTGRTVIVLLGVALCAARPAAAQPAPDASVRGPFTPAEGFYTFPAAVDPNILPGRMTQIVARVYRPNVLAGQHPVIVMLHGNHSTCGRAYRRPPLPPPLDPPGLLGNPRIDNNSDFTTTGTCPNDPVTGIRYDPVPSYLGYAYLATRLASHGYVVVSIDANRGITAGEGVAGDSFLIRARGRLVLTHLQLLSGWNVNGGTPATVGTELQGTLDFDHVGLMGHSRGGEGVRAAYNLYNEAGSPWPGAILDPVAFSAIFEIGPTDNVPGEAGNTFDADGTVWNVLLPMCDGDVRFLSGVKPFDRMMTNLLETPPAQKSTYTVWGANHNFYNTQWQVTDLVAVVGGTFVTRTLCTGAGNAPLFPISPDSAAQRLTALSSVLALFRGNVGAGADATFNQNFNTLFGLPANVTDEAGNPMAYPTRVDRGYSPSASFTITRVAEDFDQPTGVSSYGIANEIGNNITVTHDRVPNHDPDAQRAGLIAWTAAGNDVYFQSNWTEEDDPGEDVTDFLTLDLRVSRQDDASNPAAPTDFSIRLVGANGILTRPVRLSAYTDLRGPVGGDPGGRHPIMQTARIPLGDFGNFDLIHTQVRGVRLIFDQTAMGAIYVGNIRYTNTFGAGAAAAPASMPSILLADDLANVQTVEEIVHQGRVTAIRRAPALAALNNQPGVEVEVHSDDEFPVRDEGPLLRIKSRRFSLSRYPPGGDQHTLIFVLRTAEFEQTSDGDEIVIEYGTGPSAERWTLGALAKSLADK